MLKTWNRRERVFTDSECNVIRKLFANGYTTLRISEFMGKGAITTIQNVTRGERAYSHLDGPVVRPSYDQRMSTPKKHAKLNTAKILSIREQVARGVPKAHLARLYGVSGTTIHDIIMERYSYTPEKMKRRKT